MRQTLCSKQQFSWTAPAAKVKVANYLGLFVTGPSTGEPNRPACDKVVDNHYYGHWPQQVMDLSCQPARGCWNT